MAFLEKIITLRHLEHPSLMITIGTRNKFLLITSMLFLLAFNICLTSCDSEEKKQRISRAERERLHKEDSLALKIGILPTMDCEAMRLADSLHIFDSLGVTVHLRMYGSLSECRIALRSKLVEGAFIDSVLADVIEKKDTTALTLGPATPLSWKLLTSKKARVVRKEQLADKIIASDSHGASKALAENMADSLKKDKKTVFIVQCEDPVVRMKMLSHGNVDAALMPEPYATDVMKSGTRVLADYSKQKKGVVAFRSSALKDKRIKKQYDLFLKGYAIALDSIAKRQK